MTEPETCSSEVDVFSDRSAHDSEAGPRSRKRSSQNMSDVTTDNSAVKVKNTIKILKKHF